MNKKPVLNAIRQWIETAQHRLVRNWFLKLVALAVTIILFYLAHTSMSSMR